MKAYVWLVDQMKKKSCKYKGPQPFEHFVRAVMWKRNTTIDYIRHIKGNINNIPKCIVEKGPLYEEITRMKLMEKNRHEIVDELKIDTLEYDEIIDDEDVRKCLHRKDKLIDNLPKKIGEFDHRRKEKSLIYTNKDGEEVEKCIASTGKKVFSYELEPGEHNKTFDSISNVYSWLAESKAQRRDTIVALGGGVVGDMAGFVAATYNRGLGFIQIPTSLAAMVDASVGGKTAVDLPEGKNLVGAFYQPKVVIADVSTLKSLPHRETMEGWAEAIKHGLILDKQLFEVFENRYQELLNLEPNLTTDVVKRSIQIKAEVVSQDEKETRGIRTLLNYGHTIGHGLEAATGYHQLLHGEAVSIGMMGAAMIGNRMGVTDSSILERQISILKKFDLPISFNNINIESIKSAMSLDKKAVGSSINWVLLSEIGHAEMNSNVDNSVVDNVLEELSS